MSDFAMRYAMAAHQGQYRPYTGEPYIAHPARVAMLLELYAGEQASDGMIAAAWLHDTIEDTAVRFDDIASCFGDITAALVDELTKPNEPASRGAMLIKACDLLDNVGTIAAVAPADQARAYLKKKAPQLIRIAQALVPYYPDLAQELGRAWLRNWEEAGN